MKIRTDYVTNSSSSSYVIAYKKAPGFDEETLTKYPFLKNYYTLIESVLFSDKGYDTTAGEVCENIIDLKNHIVEHYGWRDQTLEDILEDDDWAREIYEDAIKYLVQNYNILFKEIGYSDYSLNDMIKQLAENNDSIIVLRKED